MSGPLLIDRVQETTTTTGTGTVTLAGAVTGYRAFSAVGDANSCYYCIADSTTWEVGIGTYALSGTTLSRDVVLASSNSNALVNFASGTKSVFVTAPVAVIGAELAQTNSQPDQDQWVYGNSIVTVLDDPLIIASNTMVYLLSGARLYLDANDDRWTGQVMNDVGNVTLGSYESTVIPGLLQIQNNGLYWLTDATGNSLVAIL